jgi:hypothetical protein
LPTEQPAGDKQNRHETSHITVFAGGLNASNIMVVDPAQVPDGPAKPRIILNLAIGFILGLAFFQEYLDNTLKTSDEVESPLRLPSVGLIPSIHLNGSPKSLGLRRHFLAPRSRLRNWPGLGPAVLIGAAGIN